MHETRALKEQFLPEILKRYEASPIAKPADYDSDRVHTSEGLSDAAQLFHPIAAPYEQIMQHVAPDSPYKMRLWHSVYWKDGEYQEPRHNLPAHFTILHFLAFDSSEHRRPVFFAPDCLARAHCDFDTIQSEIWSQEDSAEFYEGDALVFPAYLEYAIPPGKYKNPMVIVTASVELAGRVPVATVLGQANGG